MSSKFEIFIGDYLPDFTRPIAIVAATTINVAHTAVERYILVPSTSQRPKKILAERLGYKIDLSTMPASVITFDSIFQEGIEKCENDIELKFYSELTWDRRAHFLREGRYRFLPTEKHRLFTYKSRYGFAQEIRQIISVSFNDELKTYFKLVDSVTPINPDSNDPIAEL